MVPSETLDVGLFDDTFVHLFAHVHHQLAHFADHFVHPVQFEVVADSKYQKIGLHTG